MKKKCDKKHEIKLHYARYLYESDGTEKVDKNQIKQCLSNFFQIISFTFNYLMIKHEINFNISFNFGNIILDFHVLEKKEEENLIIDFSLKLKKRLTESGFEFHEIQGEMFLHGNYRHNIIKQSKSNLIGLCVGNTFLNIKDFSKGSKNFILQINETESDYNVSVWFPPLQVL